MTGFADGAGMICPNGEGRMRGIVARDAGSARHGIGGVPDTTHVPIPCYEGHRFTLVNRPKIVHFW